MKWIRLPEWYVRGDQRFGWTDKIACLFIFVMGIILGWLLRGAWMEELLPWFGF